MADTNIIIGGDTRQLERDIQATLSKDFKLKGFDAKSFSQPLGKIRGQLGEFEKSLEASNARVVAFGASAGSVYLLTDAFKSMIQTTISVEKNLADINTVLNVSEKDIKSFGNTIFDVANKTSQSFEIAADAALEFSRQGLGLEETAKRTADALTLARLSGLSAASSVEALTAAINSYGDASLNTTQIVNKLAAVDARYAVSSADLAEAIKRVGSSASEAGVNIDELIALVTSAQQTTARGGAVIGNSFKTIFTRLQRPKVLEDLRELGIQTSNSIGETLPLIQILSQLARSFDNLGSAQKSQVAELVGGVYQINILKAILGDLSKEYSTYSGALRASSGATNEAEVRIGKLGETLDSQLNRVTNNLKRAGSIVGELTIAPALEKVLSNVNSVLETFALGKEPESFGEKAATGFLKGLGSFISGPGLLLGATAAFQIFKRLATFVGDAGKTILGLGQAAQQQAQIQAQILQLLQRNPQLYAQIESGAVSVQSAAQGYLAIVNATNAALERQKNLASQIAAAAGPNAPIVMGNIGSGRPVKKGKANGYMPSISDQKRMEERDARNLGAPVGVRAHFGKGTIGGKKFLMNNHEIEIPNYGANGDSAVIPKYAAGTPIKTLINSPAGGNLSDVYDINRPSDKYINIQQKIPRFDLPRTNEQYQKKARFYWDNSLKTGRNPSSLKYRGISLGKFLTPNAKGPNQIQGALGEIDTFLSLKNVGFSEKEINKLPSSKGMDFSAGKDLFESKTYRGVSDKSIIAKTLMFIGRSGKYKNNKTADIIPIGGIGGIGMSLFEPKKASSGYIPRFAAGDGSISLKDYMMMKYGEVKDASSLGGAALNAAYGKGVSLDELRATSPKWANWTPGGATNALRTGRASARLEAQKEFTRKYGFRKIILPWDKTLADFGGDAKKFGQAYEELVAGKFGGKRADRFKSANEYGAYGANPITPMFNTTAVDFINPKSATDLSLGGTLIEARGGDKKNYNPSDISKKFEDFFNQNPSYDPKKWKRVLISRNAAGYIPRFAKGSKQKRRARYNLRNPRLLPSNRTYTGEQINEPSKPALKLAPRFSKEDLIQQRIAEAETKSQARKKAKFAYPVRTSLSLQNNLTSMPSGFSQKLPLSPPLPPSNTGLTAEQRLQRANESGKTLLGGGKKPKFDSSKAFMASMALSQGLGMAQSFGLINPESQIGQFATKGTEMLSLGMTAKGLYSEYGAGIGKRLAGTKLGKSAIGRGVAGFAGRFGASSILGMSSMGLIGGAVGAGLLGREAIDYFGTPGGFGTRQIGKEQEDAAKELARYKTETGKSISSYLLASSSKYGFGNEEFGGLRKEAIQRISGDLGGMENVSRLLKESGGVGMGKGSADQFTKSVISNLQGLGKEVGDLADPKNFGKAKDLAAGLIAEVNKFEKIKSVNEILGRTSEQMSTLAARATMMLTVYRELEKKELQRGETLKKNFAGGAEGYFDPNKSADSMLNINRALRTLNDPRLARNQMERGRAAQQYLTSATEMGIDIAPQVREQLSKIMDAGLRQYQGQNLNTLMRIGGGYRNNFGLQQGMLRGFMGTGAAAARSGLSIQEAQLSQNQQAVEAGYLNRLDVNAMGMLGNPKAIKTFQDTAMRIKQAESDLNRLAQGVATGKVSMQEFQKVSGAIQTASKISEKDPQYAQTQALAAIEQAFKELSQQSQVIAKFGEAFTAANNINLSGNVNVGLTPEAVNYLTVAEAVYKANNKPKEKEGVPPQVTNLGQTYFNMYGMPTR